jgi:hypothetical protein
MFNTLQKKRLADCRPGFQPNLKAQREMTNDENRMTKECLNALMLKVISDPFGIRVSGFLVTRV